jgi:hypothetical protein
VAVSTAVALTTGHRAAQIALRARFLRRLLRNWPLLDPRRLDATRGTWLDVSLSLVREFRGESAALSRDYYSDFRLASVGEPFEPGPRVIVRDLPPEARVSLEVTGPVLIKRQTAQGIPLPRAESAALEAVSGSASRHVLNGGRAEIHQSVLDDSKALGFLRVTDGDPCYFCAMLASRGMESKYRTRQSALTRRVDGEGELHRYHDHCACTAMPVFDEDAALPGLNQEAQAIWRDSTKRKSGDDAIKAFRAAWGARPR